MQAHRDQSHTQRPTTPLTYLRTAITGFVTHLPDVYKDRHSDDWLITVEIDKGEGGLPVVATYRYEAQGTENAAHICATGKRALLPPGSPVLIMGVGLQIAKHHGHQVLAVCDCRSITPGDVYADQPNNLFQGTAHHALSARAIAPATQGARHAA